MIIFFSADDVWPLAMRKGYIGLPKAALFCQKKVFLSKDVFLQT